MKTRWLYALLSFLFSLRLLANIGAPLEPPQGQLTGEPFISQHCKITREDLSIDLRPLAQLEPGIVNATYYFTSDTASDNVELILVANNLSRTDYYILLDGVAVSGDTTSLRLVPNHWLTPRYLKFQGTPFLAFDSSGSSDTANGSWYYNFRKPERYVRFSISIDSGQHKLEVKYYVDVPQSYYGTTLTHLFTYILSPATDWNEFRNLTVHLQIPEGWSYESNLKFEKSEEVLTGYWENMPEDYLYVVTKLSDKYADWLQYGFVFTLWGLVVTIVAWLIYKVCVKYVNAEISSTTYWTVPLWFMVIASILIYMIYVFRVQWLKAWYGNQLDPDFAYNDAYLFMVIPVLWFFGVGICYLYQSVLIRVVKARKKEES